MSLGGYLRMPGFWIAVLVVSFGWAVVFGIIRGFMR